MNIQYLQEFSVLAEYGNYTAASSKCGISQPSLSKHIAQIEEELKVSLFIRDKSGVTLTPAGEILLGAVREMLRTYDKAISDLAFLGSETIGKLSVDVFIWGMSDYVYPIISKMKEQFPQIHLEVNSPHPVQPIQNLRAGKTDIAQVFRYPHPGNADLEYYDLGTTKFCVGMPPFHRLADKEYIFLKDLENETLVYAKPYDEFNSYFRDYLERHHLKVKDEIIVDTIDMLFFMAESYNVLIPMQSISLDPNYRNNVFKHIADSDSSVMMSYAWNKNNENPCIPAFLTVLKRLFPVPRMFS